MVILSNHDDYYLSFLQSLLMEREYEVIITTGDMEAYLKARDTKPDIVVLDMPVLVPSSAFSTLNLIRLDPKTKYIPVVLCSAMTDMIYTNAAHLQKMNCAIVIKPFDLSELVAKIEQLLGT